MAKGDPSPPSPKPDEPDALGTCAFGGGKCLDEEAGALPATGHACREIGCPCNANDAPPGSAWSTRVYCELRRVVLNFSPSWFSVTMGTGMMALVLRSEPYQFRGLDIISDIVFALNVFLFCLFLLVGIFRYLAWPHTLILMLLHPSQSLYVGTFAMGFATIVNLVAVACAEPWGYRYSMLGWVLWWIDASLAFVVCIGFLSLMSPRHSRSFHELSALWLLPVVCPVVSASSGSMVANTLTVTPARITVVISWFLYGMGLVLCFMLLTMYFARLAVHKIPPPSQIASTFLPLGPCGQGAYTVLKLSQSGYNMAHRHGEWLLSSDLTTDAEARVMGTALYACSIPMALILWGVGLVCLILALLYVLDIALIGRFRFNLGWWGTVYPLGVFTLATMELAHDLNSTTLRVISTILLFLELIVWLIMVVWSVRRIYLRQLYVAPCLQDTDEPTTMSNARKYVY